MSGASSWLEVRAAQTPGREALRFAGESWDYAGMLRAARSLAAALELAAGVGPGDVVAALLPNGSDYALLLHALRLRRATLLPLNLRLTPAELRHQLNDARARLLVHSPAWSREAAATSVARAAIEGGVLATPVADVAGVAAAHADLARGDVLAVVYTSGTTGRPKGALLSESAFEASARASAALLGEAAGERWLACMPLFHVGGLSILLRATLAGACAVVHERFDPEAVSRSLDREGITGVSLVAAMLRRLLDLRGAAPSPPALRCLLLGGGPASTELLARALALGYPLAPTYGLTEAASQVATRRPGEDTLPLDAGLRPLPGTELRIEDDTGEALAPGEAGEICVRGPTLMRGYLGRPEASARALRGGWLHTGDVGRLDDAGHLQVLDRRDDLIVSGGENVYPAEVEVVLEAHPAVAEAAVVAEDDAHFGARPRAFWVAADAGAPEPQDLADFCRARLAAYKVPISFTRLESLPRNASGKLLRRQLRSRDRLTPPAPSR